MNDPNPVRTSDPTTPGNRASPTALGAATTTALAGAPLSGVIVWILDTYGSAHGKPLMLDATTATLLGGFGAALLGYLFQCGQALVSALIERLTKP